MQNEQVILNEQDIKAMMEALDAGACVSDVANISPEMIEGLYTLGYNLYSSGNYPDAETVFKSLCLYKHAEPRFWMGLAGSQQGQQNYAAAVEAYAMASVVGGLQDPQPILFAVQCYLKMGDKENAIGALQGMLHMGDAANPEHAAIHEGGKNLLAMLEAEA